MFQCIDIWVKSDKMDWNVNWLGMCSNYEIGTSLYYRKRYKYSKFSIKTLIFWGKKFSMIWLRYINDPINDMIKKSHNLTTGLSLGKNAKSISIQR